MTDTPQIAAVGFAAAALGTLLVGWSSGTSLASLLPLALLVGALFALGNVLVEWRRRP